MNKSLFATLLFLFGMLFTFTACLDDDDDNKTTEMSQHDKEVTMRALAGSYNGKLHFYNPGHIDNKDSMEMHWTLSDYGIFTSEDFPVTYLRNYVPSTSEEYKILTAALSQPYKAAIDPMQSQQVNTGVLYLCRFTPNSYTYHFTVDYDGNSYDVTLNLLASLVRQEGTGSSNYSAISEHSVLSAGEVKVIRMYGYVLMDKMTINGKTFSINDYAMMIGRRN